MTSRFDQDMFSAALAFYGLPSDYNRTFSLAEYTGDNGKPQTHLKHCTPKEASLRGNACWVQANQPFADAALSEYDGKPKKAKNTEIQFIRNITLDAECPPDPPLAHQVFRELHAYLVDRGLIDPSTPGEDSGAGWHLSLPIPAIETTRDTAKQWNAAIGKVVKEHIQPEFNSIVRQAGIEMDLCGYDISRVISFPGTWRPHNTEKADCEMLQRGYLRRWLPPYVDGNYPLRKESTVLGFLVRDAYEQISREQSAHKEAQVENAQEGKQSRKPNNALPGDTPYGLKALVEECSGVRTSPNGGRNTALNKAAFRLGQLIGGDELTQSTVERELSAAAESSGLPSTEVEKTMRSGLQAGIQEPRTRPTDDDIYGTPKRGARSNHHSPQADPKVSDVDFVLQCLSQGEYGDALLFTHLFQGQVVFDHSEQEWYMWAGHYWELDTIKKIKHLVSGKLASVYLRAGAELNLQVSQQEAKAEASGDEEEKLVAKERVGKLKSLVKSLTERAFLLRQAARSKNVLYFASSNEGMGVKSDIWDRDKWLRAVPNGVIDLHTGTLRPGQPTDYIRTSCPTFWEGIDAPAPRWEKFLQEIFDDRSPEDRIAIIGFLQRLFGYGVTGEVVEHIFVVLYGEDGRNGKDTIQNALSHVLGDISGAISKDVLLDTGKIKAAGSATPHLSDLQGRCIAWASEPEKGARFNVGQIKELSGGGKIPTRGLFEKRITKIDPTHLLVLLTNHKPHADANDTPFWDRLRLITFNMRFVDTPKEKNERKKDPMLWKELQAEASGILAWLVRGCLEWQEQGLNTPPSVLSDGNQYRHEEDTMQKFIDECCIVVPYAKAKASLLYQTYCNWCSAGKMHPLNSTNFGLQIGKKKFEKKRLLDGFYYIGIGVRGDEDGNHVGFDTENVGSMYGSEKPYISPEPAPEADATTSQNGLHVGYVGFFHKVPKSAPREGQNLELTEETIHTIHNPINNGGVEQPGESDDDAMYSTEQTIHGSPQTIHGESEEEEKVGTLSSQTRNALKQREHELNEQICGTLFNKLKEIALTQKIAELLWAGWGEKYPEKEMLTTGKWLKRVIQERENGNYDVVQEALRSQIKTFQSGVSA